MTEPMLDLTIIIPSYNTRELLRDCIQSIYQHTKDIAFEIICLDDNSPDRSADMVAESFPDVILVRNKVNEFYAKNNNRGMSMSRARYACLLNSDTKLIGPAFEALVRFMDDHPEAATCGPKLLNPDGSVQHCIRRFAGLGTFFLQSLNWHKLFPNSRLTDRYYTTQFDYSKAQQVESVGTTAYMVRRSTWEQAGMLDERFRWFMADLAYNYMLTKKGYKIFYTPCTEIVHYGSQTVNQKALKALREQSKSFIEFSEAYDYFGKGRFTKALVRFGVWARYFTKVVGYYFSSDKRVIKGPGAPKKEIAAQYALMAERGARGANRNGHAETARASLSQSGSDIKSVRSQ
jgi:GT2 family glycosyltransferase